MDLIKLLPTLPKMKGQKRKAPNALIQPKNAKKIKGQTSKKPVAKTDEEQRKVFAGIPAAFKLQNKPPLKQKIGPNAGKYKFNKRNIGLHYNIFNNPRASNSLSRVQRGIQQRTMRYNTIKISARRNRYPTNELYYQLMRTLNARVNASMQIHNLYSKALKTPLVGFSSNSIEPSAVDTTRFVNLSRETNTLSQHRDQLQRLLTANSTGRTTTPNSSENILEANTNLAESMALLKASIMNELSTAEVDANLATNFQEDLGRLGKSFNDESQTIDALKKQIGTLEAKYDKHFQLANMDLNRMKEITSMSKKLQEANPTILQTPTPDTMPLQSEEPENQPLLGSNDTEIMQTPTPIGQSTPYPQSTPSTLQVVTPRNSPWLAPKTLTPEDRSYIDRSINQSSGMLSISNQTESGETFRQNSQYRNEIAIATKKIKENEAEMNTFVEPADPDKVSQVYQQMRTGQQINNVTGSTAAIKNILSQAKIDTGPDNLNDVEKMGRRIQTHDISLNDSANDVAALQSFQETISNESEDMRNMVRNIEEQYNRTLERLPIGFREAATQFGNQIQDITNRMVAIEGKEIFHMTRSKSIEYAAQVRKVQIKINGGINTLKNVADEMTAKMETLAETEGVDPGDVQALQTTVDRNSLQVITMQNDFERFRQDLSNQTELRFAQHFNIVAELRNINEVQVRAIYEIERALAAVAPPTPVIRPRPINPTYTAGFETPEESPSNVQLAPGRRAPMTVGRSPPVFNLDETPEPGGSGPNKKLFTVPENEKNIPVYIQPYPYNRSGSGPDETATPPTQATPPSTPQENDINTILKREVEILKKSSNATTSILQEIYNETALYNTKCTQLITEMIRTNDQGININIVKKVNELLSDYAAQVQNLMSVVGDEIGDIRQILANDVGAISIKLRELNSNLTTTNRQAGEANLHQEDAAIKYKSVANALKDGQEIMNDYALEVANTTNLQTLLGNLKQDLVDVRTKIMESENSADKKYMVAYQRVETDLLIFISDQVKKGDFVTNSAIVTQKQILQAALQKMKSNQEALIDTVKEERYEVEQHGKAIQEMKEQMQANEQAGHDKVTSDQFIIDNTDPLDAEETTNKLRKASKEVEKHIKNENYSISKRLHTYLVDGPPSIQGLIPEETEMLKRPETLTNLNPILNDISDKLGLQSNMLRDSRQAEVILSAQGQSIKTHEGLVTHAENRIDQIGLSNRSILLTNEIPFKANPYAASAENTTAAAERDATTTNYPQMLSNILGSQSMSEANILSIKQMLEDSSAKKDEINEIAKIATYGNAEMLSSAVHRTASAIATSNKNFMQDIGSLTRVSPTFIDNRKRQEPLVTVPPIDGTAVENANKAATENKALESERKRFIDTKPANPNPLQSEKKTQEVLAEGKTAVTEPTTEGGVQVPVAPQTTAAVTTPAPQLKWKKHMKKKN